MFVFKSDLPEQSFMAMGQCMTSHFTPGKVKDITAVFQSPYTPEPMCLVIFYLGD